MKPHSYTVGAKPIRLRRGARVYLSEEAYAKRPGLLRPIPGHPGWFEVRESVAWFWPGERFGHWGELAGEAAVGCKLVESGDKPRPSAPKEDSKDPRAYRKMHQTVEAAPPVKTGLPRGEADPPRVTSKKKKAKKKARSPEE